MTGLAPQAYILVLALALMGGAIAWAGDAIGYRLGKMRVSMFGLRPRVTATAIGIISGTLVACITIAILAATVKDVRLFLFQIDEIQNQLAQATAQLQTAQQARAKAEQDAAAARGEAQQLSESVGALTEENQTAESRNRQLQGQSDRLATQVRGANRQIRDSQARLSDTLRKTRGVEENLRKMTAQLEEVGIGWGVGIEASSKSPPAFVVNQLLATRIIGSGRSSASIAADLTELLFAASDIAEGRGAKVGDNGRAIRVVRLQVAGSGEQRKVEQIEEPQRIRDVSAFLAAQPRADYVVGVYAAKNIFPDAQGIVDLAWTPNAQVYKRGEVVLTTPVDGALPEARIYDAVSDIVYRRLRLVAQEAGVLPQPGTNTYGRFDPPELLFEVTRLIRQRRAPVDVRVVVTQDCWTSGPLQITLELGPRVSP